MLTTQVHDFDHIVLHDGSHIDVTADFECNRWIWKAICFFKGWIHYHAIESIIAAATRAFYVKKHVLCAKNILIGTRLRYINTTIYKIACFAGSSTTLTRHHCHRLDVAFRSLLRKVVGHPPNWDYSRPFHELLHECHLRISHFCARSNIRTWSEEVRKRQWQFVGSVMRGRSDKWCFQLMNWRPADHCLEVVLICNSMINSTRIGTI